MWLLIFWTCKYSMWRFKIKFTYFNIKCEAISVTVFLEMSIRYSVLEERLLWFGHVMCMNWWRQLYEDLSVWRKVVEDDLGRYGRKFWRMIFKFWASLRRWQRITTIGDSHCLRKPIQSSKVMAKMMCPLCIRSVLNKSFLSIPSFQHFPHLYSPLAAYSSSPSLSFLHKSTFTHGSVQSLHFHISSPFPLFMHTHYISLHLPLILFNPWLTSLYMHIPSTWLYVPLQLHHISLFSLLCLITFFLRSCSNWDSLFLFLSS